MKFLGKLLLFLILIVLLAAGGVIGFAYFKYNINPIALVKQVRTINKEVDESTLVKNPYSEEDFANFKAKYESLNGIIELLETTCVSITDREMASYINDNKEDLFASLPFDMDILELTFLNIDNTNNSKTDFRILFKIHLEKFKEEQMASFPLSTLKGIVPDTLYLESLTYEKSNKEPDLKINGMDEDEQIFNVLKIVDESLAKDNLKTLISEKTYGSIFGEDGFVTNLKKENKIIDYKFEKIESTNQVNLFLQEKTYHITYLNAKGTNPNPFSYKNTDNEIHLQPSEANGYQFLGWYTPTNQKIEIINPKTGSDYILSAKYEIIEYTIHLDLHGGKIGDDSSVDNIKYTIESSPIHIPNPTKTVAEVELEFKGWVGTNIDTPTKDLVINTGTYGNIELVANYEGEQVFITLKVNGTNFKTFQEDLGTTLTKNDLNAYLGEYLPGFSTNDWYTGEEKFDYYSVIKEDITLEARNLKYAITSLKFLPYYNKFKNATNITLNSPDELDAYISYVLFYNIGDEEKATLTFNYEEKYGIADACQKNASNEERFESNVQYVYSTNTIYVATSSVDTDASLVYDSERTKTYSQINYLFASDTPSTRSNTFDDFNIERRPFSIPISTSNQLYYAIMNGVNPDIVPGSQAEDMYLKAKDILRTICDDSDTNLQKAYKIYKWLALNINYDHGAADAVGKEISNKDSAKYDSWYIEGVLNNRKAVCEGYAKTFVLLAGLEGIPAITVSGNGHEWNKVLIDGIWYNLDATHADTSLEESKSELFTSKYFLFTDKLRQGSYDATNYLYIECDTTYNYYQNALLDNQKVYIDSSLATYLLDENFDNLVDYIKAKLTSGTASVEVLFKDNLVADKFGQKLASSFTVKISSSDYNGNKLYNYSLTK